MYTNVHSQNNYQANLSNRSYGFKELAVLYFPNIAPASASIRLKQWIKDDVELLGSLEETNYHLRNRANITKKYRRNKSHNEHMNAPVAQPLPRLQPTPFGGGTPCGKGGDHAHRLSASPKGGREGGRTKIPLYKFIDNSVSIPLPAFIYG